MITCAPYSPFLSVNCLKVLGNSRILPVNQSVLANKSVNIAS